MKKWIDKAVCVLLCLMLIIGLVPIRGGAASFFDEAELLEIKTHIEKDAGMSQYATVQGACTDGEFAYFAVQEYSTVILKYDLKTWKLRKKATVDGLGHANDMTYNASEDIIVVANNESKDDVLTILDPETLEAKRTVKVLRKKTAKELEAEKKAAAAASTTAKKNEKDDKNKDYKELNVYSVAYRASDNRYIVGLSGSYNFAVLDKDFKVVKQYKGKNTGYTRQGCDCDDDYIYFPQSDGDNIVVVYDRAGKYLDTVSLNHSHEVENLFHVGSDFYLTLHYYGNSVRRVGLSDDTLIRFGVRFNASSGKGKMEPVKIHYGEDTGLPKCTYQKTGYFFGGWKAVRNYNNTCLGTRLGSDTPAWLEKKDVYDDVLIADRAKVSKLTRIGDVTLSAFWISREYEIRYDPGTGEGRMDPDTVAYGETFTLPQCRFTRYGYVFVGYTARRDCDGRVYGYPKGSDQPRWLEEKDMRGAYLFSQGEEVSRLTYDGAVTMTAAFSTAFRYDPEQRTLLSYIGVDSEVTIPNPSGRMYKIAEGAFTQNDTMTRLVVPATIEVVARGAVSDCSALREVVFLQHFPTVLHREWSVDSGVQRMYLVIDDQPLYLGLYNGRYSIPIITRAAAAIRRSSEDRSKDEPVSSPDEIG